MFKNKVIKHDRPISTGGAAIKAIINIEVAVNKVLGRDRFTQPPFRSVHALRNAHGSNYNV